MTRRERVAAARPRGRRKTASLADSASRAQTTAGLLDEQKAEDIQVLDLRGVSDVADFFIIATARSESHMRAVAHRVGEALREAGLRPYVGVEDESPRWSVMDYGDVVVHLFDAETRRHYRLEELWADAAALNWRGRTTA